MLASANKEYNVTLVDTAAGSYELKILKHGIEFAHYPFQGELVSAYWSPSLRFVALDNHYGHGGFYVWIISLTDGSVVTSHGPVKAQDYDRYTDYNYFSDLLMQASAEIKKIYPEANNDRTRDGYSSVAYGWLREDRILMFHEFPFDNLFTKDGLIIQAYTTSKVTNYEVTLEDISLRKVKDDQDEPMPKEIKKTLNFIE